MKRGWETIVYRAAPYILIVGIILMVLDGLWVVEKYDSYVQYPKEALIYFIVGISLTIIAFLIVQFGRKGTAQRKIETVNDLGTVKDNRIFIKKIWMKKLEV